MLATLANRAEPLARGDAVACRRGVSGAIDARHSADRGDVVMTAIVVPVPSRFHVEKFGERVIAGYAAGRKATSAALAVPGKPRIDGDAYVQAVGRAGEIAVALYLGLDPFQCLDWSDDLDDGADLVVGRWRVDVKTSPRPDARLLIWPVSKRLDRARSDVFVAARVKSWISDGNKLIELLGWFPRSQFQRHAQVARDGSSLAAGTMSIAAADLLSLETLRVFVKSPADWFAA